MICNLASIAMYYQKYKGNLGVFCNAATAPSLSPLPSCFVYEA